MVDLSGEVVVKGAMIWTSGLSWDAAADELHLLNGRVVGIGRQGVVRGERLAGGKEVVLPGGMLTPSFFDAHLHLDFGGKYLTRVQLDSCRSADEVLKRLHEAAPSSEGWLIAIGLPENAWPKPADFHAATAGRPTLAMTRDYHSAFINREGMKALGLTASTELPVGGKQDIDKNGEPLGILRENAVWWVEERLPKPSDEQAENEILTAQKHLIRLGILGVSDASDTPEWPVLKRLEESGRLSLRVEHWHRCLALDEACIQQEKYSSETLIQRRIKTFLDGALGSRSAWMLEDYADAPGQRGAPVPDLEHYLKFLSSAAEAGWSHAVHAIGDAAVAWAAQNLPNIPAPEGFPHRLEHIQHIDIDSVEEIHHSPLIGSLQPTHRLADAEMLEPRLGLDRCAWAFPQRSLKKGGKGIVFGTDWPVVSAKPGLTIEAAMSPRSPGEGMPGEEMTLETTLDAMTVYSAEAGGFTKTGRLDIGFNADMIWLSHPPGRDPSEWRELQIGTVWKEGTLLHQEA